MSSRPSEKPEGDVLKIAGVEIVRAGEKLPREVLRARVSQALDKVWARLHPKK